MFNKIRTARLHWHHARMSELGLEILELMTGAGEKWVRGEHSLRHEASGIKLWVSNGERGFTLHDVAQLPYVSAHYRDALNRHDRIVMWDVYKRMVKGNEVKPAQAALNAIRMYKIKASETK